PDAQILWWVQQGDYRAFTLLFDRYYPSIERYAACLLRDPRAAGRAASAAMENGFRDARRPRQPRCGYPAHLFLLCRRAAFRVGKRSDLPRRAFVPALWPSEPDAVERDALPLSVILSRERDKQVRRAYDGLSAGDREIIHLAFEPVLRREDLAAILKCPSERAVTDRLLRALSRLGAAVLRSPGGGAALPGAHYAERSASNG
ncbi:MAG TPA: hypothetical protein VKT77_16690, partial [Chthonomonadaceae bacterium]|nr:hypothetical protein [Chthonomonadaceae bacterium]